VYAPGGTVYGERSLVWVDQKGSVQPVTSIRRPFEDLSVSPDGRRIALTVEGAAWNIWILEIARGTLSRLTLEQDNRDPLWTPDGRRLFFRNRDKLMAAPLDFKPTFSAGAPQVLFEGRYEHAGHDYALSGGRFVFIKEAEQTRGQTEIRILQNWGEELDRVASA